MENLKIEKDKISWERSKVFFGMNIRYESTIQVIEETVSITKTRYVNSKRREGNLVHVPIELIDEIKNLVSKSNFKKK